MREIITLSKRNGEHKYKAQLLNLFQIYVQTERDVLQSPEIEMSKHISECSFC